MFPSFPAPAHPTPPHPHLPQGLPCPCWTPNSGWILLSVGTPPFPQPPLRGAGNRIYGNRSSLYFCSPFPPSPSLRTHAAGGGLCGQSRPEISAGSWGPKWAGENWLCSLLILCPPTGPPISPFGCVSPSSPPAAPQGRQSSPASTTPPPLTPPLTRRPTQSLAVPPVPLGICGPPPVPRRCLVGALVVWRCKFHLLLVCHLDSAPKVVQDTDLLFLIFLGTSILLCIVVAPVYIPTSSAQGFPFLHSITNTCYLLSFS